MELGEVRYSAQGRRWERFDGHGWVAIVTQAATAQAEVIVYESTDHDE